jgi:hypothetical protein
MEEGPMSPVPLFKDKNQGTTSKNSPNNVLETTRNKQDESKHLFPYSNKMTFTEE